MPDTWSLAGARCNNSLSICPTRKCIISRHMGIYMHNIQIRGSSQEAGACGTCTQSTTPQHTCIEFHRAYRISIRQSAMPCADATSQPVGGTAEASCQGTCDAPPELQPSLASQTPRGMRFMEPNILKEPSCLVVEPPVDSVDQVLKLDAQLLAELTPRLRNTKGLQFMFVAMSQVDRKVPPASWALVGTKGIDYRPDSVLYNPHIYPSII